MARDLAKRSRDQHFSKWSCAVIASLWAVALPAVGRAEGPRAAALVPELRPSGAPELRDRFHEAVTRGLRGMDGELLSAVDVRLRLGTSEDLLACGGQPSCVGRVATTLRTTRLIATEVMIAGKDYVIKLRLIDGSGRELAKADETCDICTVKEADEAATRAATKLTAASRLLPAEPPQVTERPAPRPTVKAPQKPVEPPPPLIGSPAQRPIETPPPAAADVHGFPFRPVAIASLVVGVAGLAAGIPLTVIDGQPTCNKPDPKHACPEVYNTIGGGATLLALGVAGVAAAAPLFYLDYRSRHRKAVVSSLELRLGPTWGGAQATASGRF
jgi:hypothetical protein